MKNSSQSCRYCSSSKLVIIDSHKFFWMYCLNCESAQSIKKNSYILDWASFFLRRYLRFKGWGQTESRIFKNNEIIKDASKIYDYFTTKDHVMYCESDALRFDNDIVKKYSLNLTKKRILDISGGNGHFINYFKLRYDCDVTLTEFNQNALNYAHDTLKIKTKYFDFTQDKLELLFEKNSFDYVFARAAVMFMDDIDDMLKGIFKILKTDGILIIQNSVIPTFGTIFRTQFDEYNYLNLYSKNILINSLKRHAYEILDVQQNYDDSLYITGLERYPIERYLVRFYEIKALKFQELYSKEILCRDRRRYDFIVKKNQSFNT